MTEAEEFFAPPAQEAKHEAMAFYRGILRGVFSVEECFALAEIPAKDAAVLAELAAENPDARPMLAAVRAYRKEFCRALSGLLQDGVPVGEERVDEPGSTLDASDCDVHSLDRGGCSSSAERVNPPALDQLQRAEARPAH